MTLISELSMNTCCTNASFSCQSWRFLKVLSAALLLLTVVGCASSPPTNTSNLCDIFDEKDDWYDDAADSKKRWGSPIEVMMAIMKQESSFKDDAAPPRTKILWFIPGPRKSSAYGYAQAKDGNLGLVHEIRRPLECRPG